MSNYVLTCESTADLSQEHFEKRNIHFICFHFYLNDQEYFDDLGKSVPFETFYSEMGKGAETRTSQVNISEYTAFWEKFLSQGLDIVHICFSSGLSGTINSARNAAVILRERFPGRKIYIVDSVAASSGYGMLMDTAADFRDDGFNAEELVSRLEGMKTTLHHWFFSADLSAYVRGGRISRTAAVFGGMLEICPLLNMDRAGRLVPKEKIRTKKKAIKAIVDRMEQHVKDGLEYSGKCYLSHSGCYEDAKAVSDLIEHRFAKLKGKVEINWVGTTIGSHTGPGTVALYFFGDERGE